MSMRVPHEVNYWLYELLVASQQELDHMQLCPLVTLYQTYCLKHFRYYISDMVLRHFATCLGEVHGNMKEHSSDSVSELPAHNHSRHFLSCLE